MEEWGRENKNKKEKGKRKEKVIIKGKVKKKMKEKRETESEREREKVLVALHDESSVWVSESQDFIKAQGSGFSRNREKTVSREITLFEVGFFSYLG